MTDPLFCPIRKKWVAALPEEKIRQALIDEMIHRLNYPTGSLALEKALHQLPHLCDHPSLPKRRSDLIVLTKNIHPHYPFYPLLLVEFKAIPLSQNVLRQIIGYNQFVKAYFIAVVNQTESCTGWYDRRLKDYRFQNEFFSYDRLLAQLK